MTKHAERNAKYYREKAREIRRFAARSSHVRLQLLELAELFDHMATHVQAGLTPRTTLTRIWSSQSCGLRQSSAQPQLR
jgi:hypothetical protein